MSNIQRGDLSFVRGLVKFLLALAYLFCVALLGSFLTRFAKNKSPLCMDARSTASAKQCSTSAVALYDANKRSRYRNALGRFADESKKC